MTHRFSRRGRAASRSASAPSTHPRLPLRLAALVLLIGACASTPKAPAPSWQEIQVHAPSDRVLWKLVLLQVERLGFPLTAGLDPGAGEVNTGWRTNLMPFRGQGDRRRLEVSVEPIEKGLWRVRAHVQRQRNMSLTSPLDPRRAEWEWAGDDPTEASIFLSHVQTVLDPLLDADGVGKPPTPER